MEVEGEPNGGADQDQGTRPGKRVLASTAPPALPNPDGTLPIMTSRREEAASCDDVGRNKKHHTRKASSFKVPTIPKPTRGTNATESSPRSEGQVDIAVPEACLDILNPDVSPGVISGVISVPLDIGFLPDIELHDPLPLGVPTTERFTLDFFQDWNPDAIRAEEEFPARDAPDIFLLQAAGDAESTFAEEPGNPDGHSSPLPTTEGFTQHLSHDWNHDAPTTEELPPGDATEPHQEDSRELFATTDVTAVPIEEETWGVDAEPNVFVHDREFTLDDIFGPRTSETTQTNMTIFTLMAPSPTFEASTSEPCGSSSSFHTLANVATDPPALTVNFIPSVVNEESPSAETIETDAGTEEEEEITSPPANSSTGTGIVVLARRSSPLLQEYQSSATSEILRHPLHQPLQHPPLQRQEPLGAPTRNVTDGKKRGRPVRCSNIANCQEILEC